MEWLEKKGFRLNEGSALRQLLDSLDSGIAIFDRNLKLLYLNDAMIRVTGGSRSSVGGALSELSRRHRLRSVDNVPIEPEDFPIAHAFRGKETRNETYIYIDPGGKPRWLSISCVRICNESGELELVYTSIEDISHIHAQQARLLFMVEAAKILSLKSSFRERMSEKARLAVPALADWCSVDVMNASQTATERLVVVHQDPKMVDYIFEFQRKYPATRENPGSAYGVIKTKKPLYLPRVTDEMLRNAARDDTHFADMKKLGLNSLLIVPIMTRGRALGALSLAYAESGRVYTDEDVRFFGDFCKHLGVAMENARLYTEVERRDKAKDLFLASLSHELRNPLAPIRSSLELLKMKELSTDVRDEVEVIEHQFGHMARLLNDLLDVTRFTHDKISVNLQPTDLKKLVERTVKSSDALLRTSDIGLELRTEAGDIVVLADDMRLEQAITNLLSNSIKYTPSGGSIWVEMERENGSALLSVRDSGAGIAPEELPNIFKMYYQGTARKRVGAGLGIGLLLVDKIIQLHGGTVEARSEGIGKGSTFTIRIPLADVALTLEDDLKEGPSVSGKRILVVDDNTAAADSLVRLLNKLGANAESAYGGDQALEKTSEISYDVMLVDIGMPLMDGYQLMRAFKERGLTTPCVALTGYGLSEDKERARKAGFSAHLTKPIGLQELSSLFAAF